MLLHTTIIKKKVSKIITQKMYTIFFLLYNLYFLQILIFISEQLQTVVMFGYITLERNDYVFIYRYVIHVDQIINQLTKVIYYCF